MKYPLTLCPLLLLLLVPHVDAAPSKAKKPTASRVFSGKPTRDRGSLPDADTSMPTDAARSASASALIGTAVSMTEMMWAHVTPRRAKHDNRAALVFTGAALVDGKRGLARWTGTAAASSGDGAPWSPVPVEQIGCLLFGCPGGADGGGDRGMQLWINGEATKRYYAECRVKLEGAKGALAITADGFDASFNLDHTGKSFARVGWVVDPSQAGWYGFSLSSTKAWTAYGCSIDELE